MAIKFNERLEVMWELPKSPWEILDFFDGWPIDKSAESLLEAECSSLAVLGSSVDSTSALKVFDRFLVIGEWPEEVVSEYVELGHYLLALSQFGTGVGHIRESIDPSKLAAAVLALTVKITNLARDECCQYDYFPARLERYSGYTFKDLQPVVRRVSSLLRSKPIQADVLTDFFPTWGRHEWM